MECISVLLAMISCEPLSARTDHSLRDRRPCTDRLTEYTTDQSSHVDFSTSRTPLSLSRRKDYGWTENGTNCRNIPRSARVSRRPSIVRGNLLCQRASLRPRSDRAGRPFIHHPKLLLKLARSFHHCRYICIPAVQCPSKCIVSDAVRAITL